MSWKKRFLMVGILAVSAAAVLTASAAARVSDHEPPPPPGDYSGGPVGPFEVNLELLFVDFGAHAVEGILHCVPPEQAGQWVRLPVEPQVDLGLLVPGQIISAGLGEGDPPPVVWTGPPTCDVAPGGYPDGSYPGPYDGGHYGGPHDGGHYGGPAGPSEPPRGMFRKTFKMLVDLEDADGNYFDASMKKMLKGVNKKMRAAMDEELEGETFGLRVTKKSKCFIKENGNKGNKVPCAKVVQLVGNSADELEAKVLVKPIRKTFEDDEHEDDVDPASTDYDEEEEDGPQFRIKKLIIKT